MCWQTKYSLGLAKNGQRQEKNERKIAHTKQWWCNRFSFLFLPLDHFKTKIHYTTYTSFLCDKNIFCTNMYPIKWKSNFESKIDSRNGWREEKNGRRMLVVFCVVQNNWVNLISRWKWNRLPGFCLFEMKLVLDNKLRGFWVRVRKIVSILLRLSSDIIFVLPNYGSIDVIHLKSCL